MNDLGRQSQTLWATTLKRPFDLITSALLFVLLSPLLLLIGGLIKLTSRGPVFFIQDRGGRYGQSFRLIKFRTMRGGRKPDPKELVPLHHPEITPLGRWLRRLKLDELPQLFNVIKGEMSLVGPRPTLLDQIAAYDEFRQQRLLARPGITGLAQVYANSLASWDERILYDIAYVRRCGVGLDTRILVRTIWVVIAGEARTSKLFTASPFCKAIEPQEISRLYGPAPASQ